MSKKKNTLSLAEWINESGVPTIAKMLKVNNSTVRHWRLGYCLPRTDQMIMIKKLSEGRVTYSQMIENHHTN